MAKARPISGQERVLERGKEWNSASVEYAKRINAEDKDAFVAGNRDSIGESPSILKQIACESRISGRLSTSELDSIIRMKNKYIIEDTTKSTVKGFIQTILVDPVMILFLWARGGIRIFHDLCKMDAVTWDATSKNSKNKTNRKKTLLLRTNNKKSIYGSHITSCCCYDIFRSDTTHCEVLDVKNIYIYMEQADFHSL